MNAAGRRSGRTIRTPIGFTRRGDELRTLVIAPDEKRWWRNFTGESRNHGPGAPYHDLADRRLRWTPA